MHQHHHCLCEHDQVKYCKHCRLVYCLACKQEWSGRPFAFSLPYTNVVTGSTYRSTATPEVTGVDPQHEQVLKACAH